MKPRNVDCAFDKWSIGIDENGQIIVTGNEYPLDICLKLGDVSSPEEYKRLSDMFLAAYKESKSP